MTEGYKPHPPAPVKLRSVSVERIGRVSLVLVIAAAATSTASGFGDPLGVAAGGVFMLLNYRLIRALVSRLIAPGVGRTPALGALVLKLGLTGVLVAGVFLGFPLEPMSFAFGASLLPLAAVLDATLLGTPLAQSQRGDRAGNG